MKKDNPFYDISGGSVTLSGGELLLQYSFLLSLYGKLHADKIYIALETAVSVDQNIFSKVISNCDLILIDLKPLNSEKHRNGVGIDNELILSNIRYTLEKLSTQVIVRIPAILNFNNTLNDAKQFAILLTRINAKRIHFLPFHQLAESKYNQQNIKYDYVCVSQLHEEDLQKFADILRQNYLDVQIGG